MGDAASQGSSKAIDGRAAWIVQKFNLVASHREVWNLRKCSGADAASCLGKNENWNDASALRSGDVVAWVSAVDSHVQAICFTFSEATMLPYKP